ncbi:esterase FE4-like [Onthophagus taurus]|uniref:esterase FE4-like n=1 Tax=Onthophagus taurus TaxID=166361 RepID=UPI0039BE3089
MWPPINYVLFSLLTFFVVGSSSEEIELTIPDGTLVGRVRYDRFGKEFYSFQSIPFAKPPVGHLRFKDPVENEPWVGIRDATQDVPECVQISGSNIIGQEDCLYLNVYTPKLHKNESNLLPVMVFMHGGGFTIGSARDGVYGPEFLITEDIVLVNLNYRLSMFGFFSLDDPSFGAPGNAGLKDQRLALEWVQRNIEYFGGDRDQVTIYGQSAGGASVHLHVLSPQSKGLFSKAIMQSGVGTMLTGVQNNGLYLAQVLGVTTDDAMEMFLTLQYLPPQFIMQGFLLLTQIYPMRWRGFNNPIVEKHKETAFLPDDPMKILREGNYNKVPMMIGYTDAEGIFYEQSIRNLTGEPQPVTDFFAFVPDELGVLPGTPEALKLADEIKEFYQGDVEISPDFMLPLIHISTDTMFAFPARRAAVEHVKNNEYPVYFYRFSADSELNIFKRRDSISLGFLGAGHADDLGYLFKMVTSPEILNGSVEDIALQRVNGIWGSFAKHSHPLVVGDHWEPVLDGVLNYMDIGTFRDISGVNPDEESMNFWLDIFERFGVL